MFVMFPDGGNLEARILQLKGAVMRLAVEGFEDIVEFRLANGRWSTEDGRTVRFLFVPEHQEFSAPTLAVMKTPTTCSAGGSCLLARISGIQLGLSA